MVASPSVLQPGLGALPRDVAQLQSRYRCNRQPFQV